MPGDAYLELTCSACGQREVVGPLQMLERLRGAGMLKRDKEPDWELPLTHAGVADRRPWF
jgi:hypothetical protein